MNDWLKDSVFYHIYPLGLCGSPHVNEYKETAFGLEKLFEWVPYLAGLGINALYLGPVFESISHGYDTSDYFKVDRRLGDNGALKRLVDEFHKSGIKVILDGVFHHAGRDFFAFADLKRTTMNSMYKDWFVNVNFNKKSPYGDGFSYDGWNGHQSLVKLNLKNRDVKEYLFSAVKFWMDEFGVDGLRLDAADYMEIGFLEELSGFCRNIRNDFLLLGEVIHGDYGRWANERILDSVTNYECYKGLWSSLNDNNYFEIAYSLNRQFGENGMYKNLHLYNFADNHDVDRVTSTLKNESHVFPLYLLLFTMPGVPSIYYGSERGIKGKKGKDNDYELRPALNVTQLENLPDRDLYEAIKKFIKLRKGHDALKYGGYRQISLSHNQFVFSREGAFEKIIVALNSSDKKVRIEFAVPFGFSRLYDILNNEEIHADGVKQKLELYPNWGRVLVAE